MKLLAIPLVIFVLLATGCGGPGESSEFTTTYKGRTLYCLVWNASKHSQSVSCDFVLWHRQNDDPGRR